MRQHSESGFALLLVFAMSAAIAIMLYRQLPRAAFEAQRSKEELLIDRGEQYTRAIQLYVSQWKRYPASMEDLEKSNNKRYLRRRYKDPMTGNDEWRLIHVDGNGVLTDSKITKEGEKKPNQNTFVSEFASIGSAPSTGTSAPNIATRRRASDGPQPDMPSAVGAPSTTNPFGQFSYPPTPVQPVQGPQPQAQAVAPPTPGQPQMPNAPGQPPAPVPFDPQKPLTAQQAYPNGMPAFPGAMPGQVAPGSPPVPGQMPAVGMNPGSMNLGPQAQQQPTFPSGPGAQGGSPASPSNNAAAKLVMDGLTKPQPNMVGGGVAGVPGLQIGGGIAGVATKYESGSIKIYNERQKYEEWEFIYDIKKDKRLAAQLGAMPQNVNANMPGGPNGGGNPNNPNPNTGGFPGNPNSGNPNPPINNNVNQGFGNQQQIPFPMPTQPPGPGRR